jgi:hypothetical protein
VSGKTRAERRLDAELGRDLLYERVKGWPWRKANEALSYSVPKPTLPRVKWMEADGNPLD